MHRHKWYIRAIQHGKFTDNGDGTLVLWKCRKCAKTRVETKSGNWSLSDLC